MKLIKFCVLFLFLGNTQIFANQPDSAYVFAYTTTQQHNTTGLHYAWSIDKKDWQTIGDEFRFLACDFGRWGEQKKMINPFLFQDESGLWHCLWTLNNEVGQFAHTTSADLYNWQPQSYPEVMHNGNVQDLEVLYNQSTHRYTVTWMSDINGVSKAFKTTTVDFKSYSVTQEIARNSRLNLRKTIVINGERQTGIIYKLPWSEIDALIKFCELDEFQEQQRSDNTSLDAVRFKNLQNVKAKITLQPQNSKAISDMLIGVFFEDINYAADGGLYAELIQNRGFEYTPHDKLGKYPNWNCYTAWHFSGNKNSFKIDTVNPIHPNQKHYAVVNFQKQGESFSNEGFDGIPIKEGEKYNFSVFVRKIKADNNSLIVRLIGDDGEVLAQTKLKTVNGKWKQQKTSLIAKKSCKEAKLELVAQTKGEYAFDMVSLFPEKTFKGRKNGLRADLAQAIADIHPRFVRFPGGCVTHGDGLNNMYHWNRTIGLLETRVPQRNIWNYHQSAGLGYFEYFQFCEDIGAEPLPVLPAGVPCQNSGDGGHGQQGGIPMCKMDNYVQEVLDLIEWANGDKSTRWGKLRAKAGHPDPFNLKYIGIGNEDMISAIFKERFKIIFDAVKAKYPEITVIGTVGPFCSGSDYVEGWNFATKLGVPMVDEHYYQTPGWFIHNQDFYDKYDRNKPKVYLGEYAAHLPGRPSNIETALSEALYLTSVERNADVVTMTSYAPLLAKEKHTQWNPDLIYFNNTEVKPTVGYYVQKLFGNNSGNTYIPSQIKLSNESKDVSNRIAISVVEDSNSNHFIIKLVNLLPVEVDATIDLSGFSISEHKAVLAVLKGNPTDRNSKPVESEIKISDKLKYNLPAYSFSIIKLKRQ